MDLRQLEAFSAVARTASFTRAAEELHLTQPAVTRQIAALETELKTRLFDRLGKSVRLTATGEALRAYAEPALRLTHEAREAIADIAQGSTGRVTVGAASTLATYVLPPVLARFCQEHPGVELILRTGLSGSVRERVLSGSVDVGVATTEDSPEPESGPLATRRLGSFETMLVTPPGHPLSADGPLTPARLAGQPLLVMETGTNLRAFVDRTLRILGVSAPIMMELDSVETIKRMIEVGLGVSLLPRAAVTAEATAGRLAAVSLAHLPLPDRQVVVLWRRDRYLSAAIKAFLERLTL